MSSGLHTLIRLHKWRLDEKRRALAELQALADKLAQDTARLEREILAEQEIARSSPEASFGYGNFAKQAIERRKRLAESVAQVEQNSSMLRRLGSVIWKLQGCSAARASVKPCTLRPQAARRWGVTVGV